MTYDVAIIGAGVVGASIARELSKFKVKVALIEKADDVSCGTSKANSGIVHAGYDPVPGSLMAKLNVKGTAMYPQWSKDMDFDFKNIGSLVVGFSDEDMVHIKKLYDRGIENGVPGMKILSQEELRQEEPNISPEAKGALLATSAGIVSPYQATWAIAENAVSNGVELFLNDEVHGIKAPEGDGEWTLNTSKGEVKALCVVNAAGLYSDEISKMAGAKEFEIKPRRGEYALLDQNCIKLAKHTLFQTPDALGKGVLVSPTADGNILIGPSAGDKGAKDDTTTSAADQSLILTKASKTIPNIPVRSIINSFSGVRAVAYYMDGKPVNDFIIEEDANAKRFINVAGICSPGLTAAPAIGEYVTELCKKALEGKVKFEANKKFNPIRKGIPYFKELSAEEKAKLIKKNPLYGRIICRCETVTEGQIVDAIHSVIGAVDLDGVKRRTRAGMGRCQAGFCSPRVTEIISRERNIPMTSVTKNGGYSFILNSETR